jgi:flagellar hook assembly protein FlgD
MRNNHIDPIELTFMKRAVVFPTFFLSLALLVFSFSPTVAWAAAPTAPTNLTATTTSSQQINLSWQDNATNEANYYVERAPAAKGTWKVIATLGANVTTYQDTGLTQNTAYNYQVRCKAGSTYSSYSNTANAMTATLAAPTGLTAGVISASSISLAWTDSTTYESNYSVERSPNGSSSWTVIATLGSNVITYTNTGLTVGTAYYYRVRAYDGTNYSTYSAVVSQTIRTITASAGANGSISPSGSVALNNGAIQTFYIAATPGYHIADVLVDGASVGAWAMYKFDNVTANHTITASFAINTYTITASAGANGTISPSGIVSVNSGATTTFTMTPNTGYLVSNVLVDGVSVGAVSTYTFNNVIANHTIAAIFELLTLSNVGISANSINTALNETTTIFYTLNSRATVTLKVIPEKMGPLGSPKYQASTVCAAPGGCQFTWDGRDNSGNFVPDEAYLYILEATDGITSTVYSPPAPTGTGSVSCSQGEGFDPYRNEPLTIDYNVSLPERVDLTINLLGSVFKVMDSVPHVPGNYSFDWNGRSADGRILVGGATAQCAVTSLLRENVVLTRGNTPKVTLLKTDPYDVQLSYGEFTRITYTLSCDANVTVTLTPAAGAAITLLNSQVQLAGAQVIQWDGIVPSDTSGKMLQTSQEGDYTVSILAVNPVTGASSSTKGCLRIWR